MSWTMPSQSTEYIRVPVTATWARAVIDPTFGTVEMAFMVAGVPGSGDWKAAEWEKDIGLSPPVYYARLLVGPVGTTLAAGTYTVWVRIIYGTEHVIRTAGTLVIT